MNMRLVTAAFQIVLFFMPWAVRALALKSVLGFQIGRGAHIGFSILLAKHVVMDKGARIGSLTFVNDIDELRMGAYSKIGRSNWVTGANHCSSMFSDQARKCQLVLGEHARVTARHHMDCTGGVEIGAFSTVAGLGTQILTHGIDIYENKQKCAPVKIGRYCFLGTSSVLLMGSCLPDFCILAAGAVLNQPQSDMYRVYGGVPARSIKVIDGNALYFSRSEGHVS